MELGLHSWFVVGDLITALLAQPCSPGPPCQGRDIHGHGLAGTAIGLALVFLVIAALLLVSSWVSRSRTRSPNQRDAASD